MRISFACIILLFLIACHSASNKKEISQIVEWIGKELFIPTDIPAFYSMTDSLDHENSDMLYKVLLYCSSESEENIKLELIKWHSLIKEVENSLSGKIQFEFYICSEKKEKFSSFFVDDKFNYPVYFDKEDNIGRLNHFPRNNQDYCFLLDRSNKVLAIGNPIYDQSIRNQYNQIFTGKIRTAMETTVCVKSNIIELTAMKVNEQSEIIFVLQNTGTYPLVIKDIVVNCGCTVPIWQEYPVKSGSETEIKVLVKPTHTGAFFKTVRVYCNIKDDYIQLRIKGYVY